MSEERHQEFITKARKVARKLWEASNEREALRKEAALGNFRESLSDGTGANGGYNRDIVLAFVESFGVDEVATAAML